MYTRFNTKSAVNYALVTPASWLNLSREVSQTVKTFIAYSQRTPSAVSSDHLLVKLIMLMGIPVSLPADRYYYHVLNNYRPVAEALGLGTDRQTPKLSITNSKMKLYKHAKVEVGIAYDDVLLAENIERDWRNLTPVNILSHGSHDISPKLLINAEYQTMPYVVYSINVPLLMLQFHAWYKNNLSTMAAGTRHNLMQFVKMYPLSNAVYSHVNLALIESVYAATHTTVGVSNSQDKTDVGNFVMNSSKLLRDYSSEAADSILAVPMTYEGIMANLKTLSGNAWDSFKLPPISPMSQTCWPLSLAALRYWTILTTLCGRDLQRMNRTRINSIKREYGMFSTEAMWKRELPNDVFISTIAEKDKLFSRF
jgi:hypothetical protein